MPHVLELARGRKDQGLVLIGVHTKNQGDEMPAYVKETGIDFPVAVDTTEATVTAYAVDSYPDYYLIDRAGKLRVADLANGDLDRAVEVLLAEKAPGDALAAQATPDPRALARRLAERWPKASYRMLADGTEIGTYVQENAVVTTADGDVLRLTDTFTGDWDGEKVNSRITTACALDAYYRSQSFSNETTDGEEVSRVRADFHDGRVVGTRAGEAVDRELPAEYVTEMTLLRCPPFLRFEEGAVFPITVVSTDTLLPRGEDQVLTCQGREVLAIGASKVPAWKLGVGRRGGRPEAVFWFGEDRQLLRALFEEQIEWILDPGKDGSTPIPAGGRGDDG